MAEGEVAEVESATVGTSEVVVGEVVVVVAMVGGIILVVCRRYCYYVLKILA